MKDKFKFKLWLGIGIILGTIVIATVALYFMSANLTSAADKIIADRTLVRSQTTALGSLAQLKHDAPEAAKYEAAIAKLLPDQYALISFGQWLQQLGNKYNVTTHFSLQGELIPPSDTAAGTARFNADAEGPSANLSDFLKDLETQAPGYLLSVDNFDFTNDGAGSRVVIQGTLFFR